MDILGIGFAELVFILIIAMMVFGPRRLPEVAAKAGKIVADLRNMSQGLMGEWQREIKAAAHLEELEQTRQELMDVKNELTQAGKTISSEAASATKTIASPAIDVKTMAERISASAAGQSQTNSTPSGNDETAKVAEPAAKAVAVDEASQDSAAPNESETASASQNPTDDSSSKPVPRSPAAANNGAATEQSSVPDSEKNSEKIINEQ